MRNQFKAARGGPIDIELYYYNGKIKKYGCTDPYAYANAVYNKEKKLNKEEVEYVKIVETGEKIER